MTELGCGCTLSGTKGSDSKDKSNKEPVIAGCCGGAVAAGGEATAGFAAGSGTDCLEGFTFQASSSNPLVSFLGGAGALDKGVSARSFALSSAGLFWANLVASTTSWLSTAGAGRPLRVLFLNAPPGPENSPPAASSEGAPPACD